MVTDWDRTTWPRRRGVVPTTPNREVAELGRYGLSSLAEQVVIGALQRNSCQAGDHREEGCGGPELLRERLVGEHSGAGLVTAQRRVLCSPT